MYMLCVEYKDNYVGGICCKIYVHNIFLFPPQLYHISLRDNTMFGIVYNDVFRRNIIQHIETL
jgi:hypothetical protein